MSRSPAALGCRSRRRPGRLGSSPEPHYGVMYFPPTPQSWVWLRNTTPLCLVEYFEYLYGVRFAIKNVTSGTFVGPVGIQRKRPRSFTPASDHFWQRCEELYIQLSSSLAEITRERWWRAFAPFEKGRPGQKITPAGLYNVSVEEAQPGLPVFAPPPPERLLQFQPTVATRRAGQVRSRPRPVL